MHSQYIAAHRVSPCVLVTHDMTETADSLQRMSSGKAPDFLMRINTDEQITQNAEFNLANQNELKILSMMAGMEIFLSITNVFVVIIISKAFITSAQVSYYFGIQLNQRIYTLGGIVTIAKE